MVPSLYYQYIPYLSKKQDLAVAFIVSRFPRDYFWMYPAILLVFIYFVLMVCIHRYAREYRFEIVAISINWIALIVSGILLSRIFGRAMGMPQ